MRSPSSSTLRLDRPQPLEGTHAFTDWSWAQARTNFVIVRPSAASPWRLADASVRGESTHSFSSVRFHVTDGERRLRCKQYYNDWWIPTVTDVSFRRPGRPLVLGDQVAFVGRDYKRHEGSCGHKWGTAVEFSLEEGTLDDAGWRGLWDSLEAAVPSAVSAGLAASSASRNYWNRWGRTEAPWDTRELSRLRWSVPTTEAMDQAAWAITADRWAPLPGTVDSLGFWQGDHGQEVQAVFRWPHTLNCSAWFRAVEDAPPSWRPLVDASEVNRPAWEPLTAAGFHVERACMDPAVGNWYYTWRNGRNAFELHMRAAKGFDARAADRALLGALPV